MYKPTRGLSQRQQEGRQSELVNDACYRFLRRLLREPIARLDRRLVCTFLGAVLAILMHRHRNYGLLLSKLGGYLRSPGQAPAGTKRLSRLLR